MIALSREQRLRLEAHGFRQAEGDVEVLHRLAGGALDQVVERRDQDGAAGNAVGEDADQAGVGAAHMPRRRRRRLALAQNVRENFE